MLSGWIQEEDIELPVTNTLLNRFVRLILHARCVPITIPGSEEPLENFPSLSEFPCFRGAYGIELRLLKNNASASHGVGALLGGGGGLALGGDA